MIVPSSVSVTPDQGTALAAVAVPLHRGDIVSLDHQRGELSSVTFDPGETIEVGTLLWTPDELPVPLISDLVERLGLALDQQGHVAVDANQRTNVPRLWAAGDVQGWTGAIEAANLGGLAASTIIHEWYGPADGGSA